jgi:hypothetical protein
VSDLTSGDSVLANFSTTAVHTATHHKQNTCKENETTVQSKHIQLPRSKGKILKSFFWPWTIICRQFITPLRHHLQSCIPQNLKILISITQTSIF